MRLIGNFDDQRQAEQFAAYLKTEGMTAHVDLDEQTKSWEMWVKEEDHFEASLAAYESFQADPNADQFKGVVERARSMLREEEKQRERIQKNVVKISQKPAGKRATLTVMTIGICAIVALITSFGQTRTSPGYRALSFNGMEYETFKKLDAAQGSPDAIDYRLASIKQGEIWRAITPIFIHYDPMHLIFNMYMFFILGQMVENRYGTFWLAMLILGTALLSNLAQGMVPLQIGGSVPVEDTGYFLSNFGGMSGVVYGLFGFVWMKSVFDPESRFYLSQFTVMILIGWLFFCMLPGDLTGKSVANWAHGIGLVIGMAVGYATSRP